MAEPANEELRRVGEDMVVRGPNVISDGAAVGSQTNRSRITSLSFAGAVCYVLWGCLHLRAAHAVYQVGAALQPGMAQGRVFQDSWNLLFFGITAIVVALTLNIRNSASGYWINVCVLAVADTGLVFFVLIPGYMPLWPGVAGPVLWILGWIFTTLAYFHSRPSTEGESKGDYRSR